MNDFKWSWDTLLIASVVFVAGICAQAQQAAWALDSTEPVGRIVEIAPAPAEQATIEEQPEKPAYWIGIRGRNVTEPVLRTQFQLAQDMGVVIEEVVEDSPASTAGLRQHDIILRANGEPVLSMEDFSRLVSSGDAKPIELRLIRLGKEETIVVVPEKRPPEMESSDSSFGFGGGGFGFDPDEADPLGAFRMFRGGLVVPPHGAMALQSRIPNGYAVTITRENDQPIKITVKKGDQTWTIVGDDKEAIEQLPEDVRMHVQGLLAGSVQDQLRNFQLRMGPGGAFRLPQGLPFHGQQDPMLERMDQLERQLRELQQRLKESAATE